MSYSLSGENDEDKVLTRRLKRVLETSEDNDPKPKTTYLQPIALSAENLLLVFTDKSLRPVDGDHASVYGDNERLSLLGAKVLDACVDGILFSGDMSLAAEDIVNRRQTLLCEQNINSWAGTLIPKLRYHPKVASTLGSTAVRQRLFSAYVGAIYLDHDLEVVQDWLSTLLGSPLADLGMPPFKKVKKEPHPSILPREAISERRPSPSAESRLQPPSSMPVILPELKPAAVNPPPQPQPTVAAGPGPLTPVPHPDASKQILPNPLSPAQPTLPFLPLFHKAASSRGVAIEYSSEFNGPSHSGRWTVSCIVNGIAKGEGSGRTKQAGREEAARKAYDAMGWAPGL